MASFNWRTPSQSHQKEYRLNPVPENLETTEEEGLLLNLYETVRHLERAAARIKETAARAKLEARQADFQSKQKKPASRRREKVLDGGERKTRNESSDEEEKLEDDDDDEELSDVEEENLQARRDARLEVLRKDVEEARQRTRKLEDANDELRQQYLEEHDDSNLDTSFGIRKKQRTLDMDESALEPASLIANLTASQTPPHEFSSKLKLNKGLTLFPLTTQEPVWTPPEKGAVSGPNELAFLSELSDFDVLKAQHGMGYNTLAVKFSVPSDSRRFSINIAAPDHDNFNSILFHFNPRQNERGGQLVINNKHQGTWGQAVNIPLSQIPLIFGQSSLTLLVQINGEGFDIFLQDQHCARLEHRNEIDRQFSHLLVQFPSTDDYGSPEKWSVYRVWWGNLPLLAQGDIAHIPGVKSFQSLHPRKLFISHLPKLATEPEVELRRAELERAFRKYGGARGVQVLAPMNSTFCFVEMETEAQADLALKEMSGLYKLHKARRTKYEALQEARAKAEADKPKVKVNDWD
jgi:Galactoside-binding lectin/RNA recognition motif. (a.k.a. RRM, RBD, or RNP domain)